MIWDDLVLMAYFLLENISSSFQFLLRIRYVTFVVGDPKVAAGCGASMVMWSQVAFPKVELVDGRKTDEQRRLHNLWGSFILFVSSHRERWRR